MKKYLSALTLISALCAFALPSAQAQTNTAPTATKKAAKKKTGEKKGAKKTAKKPAAHSKAKKTATKKTAGSKTHAHAHTESHPLAREVQAKHSYAKAAPATASKMPFSSDADDDDKEPDIGGTKSADFSCEMGNKLTIYKNDADVNRLTRVSTTTGANRFENRKTGLVWIGIPAKGILLDSKKGQQLANECKNSDPATAAAPGSMAPNS
jgi:hypothetical protein